MADEPMFVRAVSGPAVETFGSNSQKSPEPTELPIRPGALEIREVVQTSTCGYIDGLQGKSISKPLLCTELTGMLLLQHAPWNASIQAPSAVSPRPPAPPAAVSQNQTAPAPSPRPACLAAPHPSTLQETR
jgi:hypothetical protein